MKKVTHPLFLLAAIPLGIFSALLTKVPVAGLGLGILAIPLYFVYPEFSKNGADVDWWFLGMIIKSDKAWVAFSIYYGILWFLLLLNKILANRENS
jgi:hypothetical protein